MAGRAYLGLSITQGTLAMPDLSPPEFPDGVATAALTPMRSDLSVDHERLTVHCRWLLDQGNDGIVLLGTTGEANSLSVSERMELLDAVVEAGLPPHRLMVGTGCCALPDTVALTRHALERGAGGVLVLPPFYYKGVSDDGLFAGYAGLIDRIGDERLRVYLYHFPRMSNVPISHSLIERLLNRFPKQITGIKDSSRDWDNMHRLATNYPGYRVYAGSEQYLLDLVRIGGAGCISATTNVTAALAARVYAARHRDEAGALQERLTRIRLALQNYPFIPALKALVRTFIATTAGRTCDLRTFRCRRPSGRRYSTGSTPWTPCRHLSNPPETAPRTTMRGIARSNLILHNPFGIHSQDNYPEGILL